MGDALLPQLAVAVPPCSFEVLTMATGHRRTRTAVARQHYRVVTAHLARVRDATYARLQLHDGTGPALDTARAALRPGDNIETRIAAEGAREPCQPREHRWNRAEILGSFSLTDELTTIMLASGDRVSGRENWGVAARASCCQPVKTTAKEDEATADHHGRRSSSGPSKSRS